MRLEGHVAAVTGAASGIGKAIAEAYAREGASVVLSDVNEEAGRAVADELAGRLKAPTCFVRADVAEPSDCEQVVSAAIARFGGLDIACNNAGIAGETNFTADYSVEGWQRVVGVNLSGVFYCMKYELAHMASAGRGAIVNIASILGAVGFAGAPAYVAAKHGILGLTKTAAVEYAQRGIRVNAVGPAFISTPLIRKLEEDAPTRALLTAKHPIGRFGKAEEVAELVLWLSSSKASYVTGAYYPIDGGYLAV